MPEKILQECPIPIVVVDSELRIIIFNTAAVVLFGISRSKAKERKLSELLFEEQDKINWHDKMMKRVFSSGVTVNQTMGNRIVNWKGKKLKIALQLEDDHSRCAAYVEDVTQILQLKEALANKANIEDTLKLRSSDVRVKIITYLFSSIIALAAITTAVNILTNKEAKTLDVLLAGLAGSLTSTLGYYFKEKAND